MEIGGDFKPLLPYLNRAKELDEREPLMAYYCRLYAVKLGMSLITPTNKNSTQMQLMQIMDQLEETKKEFQQSGSQMPTDEIGKEYVKQFAYRIFLQADNEDRSGQATDKTAKKFLFSSNFFDVLKNFGELPSEISEKQRYAKWKASDIIKAIKEGRKPTPGPPGGDPNLPPNIGDGAPKESDHQNFNQNFSNLNFNHQNPSHQNNFQNNYYQSQNHQNNFQNTNYQNNQSNFGQSNFNRSDSEDEEPQKPQQPQQPQRRQPPPQQPPQQPQQPQQPKSSHQAPKNKRYSKSDSDEEFSRIDPTLIANVQKHCKFAMSALNYEDVPTAIDYLEKALQALRSTNY